MDLELKGKTAIITGGSRGIGKAVGREFGLEGMKVALVARGQDALEECARERAEETGGEIITNVADNGNTESVQAMYTEQSERLGRGDLKRRDLEVNRIKKDQKTAHHRGEENIGETKTAVAEFFCQRKSY